MSGEINKVTRSRFEIEESGEVAYLEFDRDSQGWMTIWHTEVPPAMRGRGVAAELAQTAFEYAKQNDLCLDLDRLARLRVAAHARLALCFYQAAQSGDHEYTVLLGLLHCRLCQQIEESAYLLVGQFELFGHVPNQLCLGQSCCHRNSSC